MEFNRTPLSLDDRQYAAVKDPCPVHDGRRWHLFGTGVRASDHRHEILHATADEPSGPWQLQAPSAMPPLDGGCVAAPGVVADGATLHMFIQTEFNVLSGHIEHLVSEDAGATFQHRGTALASVPDTGEAGIYDAHPAVIDGGRYLVYSGFAVVGQPDIYLARSTSDSWDGPYERLGRILEHPHVPCHNQLGDADYEWGLEGAQLLELPDGRVLLHAVCFLPGAPPGCRQRIFVGLADDVGGPYDVRGPAIEPAGGPRHGENGHGGAVISDGAVLLFFQERTPDGRWGYALAEAPLGPVSQDEREVA